MRNNISSFSQIFPRSKMKVKKGQRFALITIIIKKENRWRRNGERKESRAKRIGIIREGEAKSRADQTNDRAKPSRKIWTGTYKFFMRENKCYKLRFSFKVSVKNFILPLTGTAVSRNCYAIVLRSCEFHFEYHNPVWFLIIIPKAREYSLLLQF